MGEPTKSNHCECSGHMPFCAIFLIVLGLIVLGGKIFRKPEQK